ncbi:MAG: Calx-beta domain-containing protein [Acidimicrobiales bacterium]
MLAALIFAGVASACAPTSGDVSPPAASVPAVSAGPDVATTDAVRYGLGGLPVSFVANQGRWDPRASWVAPGAEATAYFLDGRVRWALEGDVSTWVVDQVLVGARAAAPRSSVAAPGVVSYLVGEVHHAGLPTATELRLDQAWPGIDVVWSGTGGHIEATYRLAPGTDPDQVRVAWQGAESVAVTGEGRLAVTTPARSFEEDAPKAYQDVDGHRIPVEVAYELDGAGAYGFRLGAYDPVLPLVIDPTVLVYAGFLGGSGYDEGRGIAVDGAGNAYVTGITDSTSATFPETVGVFQAANGGLYDAFVAKVNPTGSALVYASFVGGTNTDVARAIAVDGAGNAYVTGWTNSTSFPLTSQVFQTGYGGGSADAFVAKVNPTGSALLYAGFLGGSGIEEGHGIAVDAAGNAYVSGTTTSTAATFPETSGAFQPENAGNDDAFVAKVNPTGSALVYAGFLGGSNSDRANGIAVDGAGNAYVTGDTDSTASTFPETVGVFQPANAGSFDGFVAKVNPTGSALLYAGFLGGDGSNGDRGLAIAVDGAGNAYVTGETDSTAATFPVTAGAFQAEANAVPYDAFVAKVNPTGSALVYASFLGGGGNDTGRGIALDGIGNAFVVGETTSTTRDFPATPGGFQPENAGSTDAFVAKVNASGSALVYAGFLGGSVTDIGFGIAVDGAGNAYVTGQADSSAATFPETPGVFQPGHAGGRGDAFVAKILFLPELSIADTSVTEGDSGTAVATFTITRSPGSSAPSSVQWSTSDGSAVSPGDYVPVAPTTVVFATGETAKTVSVTVNGDTAVEPNDGFTVSLSSPSGAVIADGTAVGRILNDDTAAISINDATVSEGNAGTKAATFTISRTGATGGPASVRWFTADSTAIAPGDYVAATPATVEFGAGQTTRTLSVVVQGDTAAEADETFVVRLEAATGASIGDGTGLGRIVNDDAGFSVNDATVTEGDSGTISATFTVSRTGVTTGSSSVRWFTEDGTASASGDYTAVPTTTLSFTAGQMTKTVSVIVRGDTAVEANETFVVRLDGAVGATISDGSGLGRITNDDVATIAVNDVTLTEGQSGTKSATFTITRSGAVGGPASVVWSTADGTAAASSDYTAVAPTTVGFGPGETIKTLSVTVLGDTAAEANETFLVRLTVPIGASIADGSGLGRITNDD